MSVTKERILSLFKKTPKLSKSRMGKILGIKTAQRKKLNQHLREMLSSGIIVRDDKGLLSLSRRKKDSAKDLIAKNNQSRSGDRQNSLKLSGASIKAVSGVVEIGTSGNATVLDRSVDMCVFIPSRKLNGAIHGDKVRVHVIDESNTKGPIGKVVLLLEPAIREVTGELLRDRGTFFRPLRSGRGQVIKVSNVPEEINDGDWIKCSILSRSELEDNPCAEFIEVVGLADDLSCELAAIVAEFDIPRELPDDIETLASGLSENEIDRIDLTHCDIIVTDPKNSADADDAVSFDGFDDSGNIANISVHIADTASYMTDGDKLFDLVMERCFTSYLPGRVIPMLPKLLVHQRCSLYPNELRNAHTVAMKIDTRTGEVISSRRFYSTIKVKASLNYAEVMAASESGFLQTGWGRGVEEALTHLFTLTAKMRAFRRREEKFIPLEIPEVRPYADLETNDITFIETSESNLATQMIEELMLATNVEVAKELLSGNIPAIYRVHSAPDEEVLDKFSGSIEQRFGLKTGDLTRRDMVVKFFNSIADPDKKAVISYEFLRCLNRAEYSSDASEHYGLGKDPYLHFTSPIRRIDCAIHANCQLYDKGLPLISAKRMSEYARRATEMEKRIDEAAREASTRLKLHYVKREIAAGRDLTYNSLVADITDNGVSVYLQDLGLYGFVRLSSFDDDYYDIDKSKGLMVGKRSGREIFCGMRLRVDVCGVDMGSKDILLKLTRWPL